MYACKDESMRLLVAALDSELVAFPAELNGFDRLVTGLGKLQAAYGLTRTLDAANYEEIVVVGTAGALDDDLQGGVYEIAAAIQHDVADLDGMVGRHIALPERIQIAEDGVVIATGDRFIDDPDVVTLIRGLGAGMVDMETYVYAWVAQKFGVPIRIYKAISDRAQDGATTTWDETVAACSAELRVRITEDYGV